MAKKKKRKRRPIAPPVHSAPEAPSHPGSPQTSAPPPARPQGAERPGTVAAPPRRKPQSRKKSSRALRTRRNKTRQWLVGVVVLALAVGAIVAAKVTSHTHTVQFSAVAAAGDCGKVRTVTGLSRDHKDGQQIQYSTSPPAGGDHYSTTTPAGFYDKAFTTNPADPLSIYHAVHSLEHGAVVIWFDHLRAKDRNLLRNHYDGQEKVIVAPYAGLPKHKTIALSAWSKLDYCGKVSTKAIDGFIGQYRSAGSAPERFNPI